MNTFVPPTPSTSGYDTWFRTKVEEALADEDGFLPHAAAMAEVDTLLEQNRAQRAARGTVN